MKKETFEELQEIFQHVDFANVYTRMKFNDEKTINKMVEISHIEYEDCRTFLDYKLGRISEQNHFIQQEMPIQPAEVIKAISDDEFLENTDEHAGTAEIKEEKKAKRKTKDKSKKINKCLLISFILGSLYSIYIVVYFYNAVFGTDNGFEALGAALAARMVAPHMFCTIIATILNCLAVFIKNKWFALAAAIAYIVAMLMFPMYFFFVIIQTILCFIGFVQLGKLKKSLME